MMSKALLLSSTAVAAQQFNQQPHFATKQQTVEMPLKQQRLVQEGCPPLYFPAGTKTRKDLSFLTLKSFFLI
jgi:hypothetical protein